MHVKLRIPVLLLFAYGFINITAQTDTISIEQVVVSAGRIPVSLPALNRSVSVIDNSRLSSFYPVSINDILETIPAVDVRERGPLGVQADVQIRGGTFDQTLVLLDGFPVNDPQTGHHNFNLPLSPAVINRIEVVRGAASRVLGPDAFSGAVNIMLRKPEKTFFEGRFTAGRYGLLQSNVTGGIKKGPFGFMGEISRTVSDGYRQNTDFADTRAMLRISADTGSFKISLLATWLVKAFGANSFYTPAFPDQYEAYRTWFTGLRYATGKHVRFRQSFWWRKSYDRFELFRSDPAPWYKGHNYHSTDLAGSGLNILIPWKGGKTSAGLDVKVQKIRSNVLGTLTGDSLPVPGETAGFYTRKASRKIFDMYLEHNLKWKRINISGGGMISYMAGFGRKAYGGIETGFRLNKYFHLYSSVNQSLRYPTFTELYYNGPVNTANADLRPEEAVTFETGIRLALKGIRGNITGFIRSGKNLIDWGRTSDTLKWQSMNLTELNTTGFESEFSADIRKLTGYSSAFFHEIHFSFYYADAIKSSGQYISKYILDYLHLQFNMWITHRLTGPFSASWSFRFQDRAGTFTEYPSGNEVPYQPFLITDAGIRMELKHADISLDISNLFDTEYMDTGNIPMPGRWVRGTMRVRL